MRAVPTGFHLKDIHYKNFQKSVKAPDFILPWLDRFYELAEIRLLSGFKGIPMDADTFRQTEGLTREALDRLVQRRVFTLHKNGTLAPGDFHGRYDVWALFEGFKDIPDEVREKLNQWELDHYIRSHEKEVDVIRRTGQLDTTRVIPRYLLLDEALDVLDKVDQVYLWPCNCRSMIKACGKPVYTCLRFDNSQGQGFEISREKAKEIVRHSNKKGLMQSGELGWDPDDKLFGALCNCCPDCCFPHLLAKELKAEKIWPKSLYTADRHEQECRLCGLCAKRCPFQAFLYDKPIENKKAGLVFHKELCRGCGLCAVTCPDHAIEMKPMKEL